MRAALLEHHGLTLSDLPDPRPGSGELLLDVAACGICGSDLHAAAAFDIGGFVMGHEFCGTVAEVGDDVEGWKEGDAAVGLSLRTCGVCPACRAGWPRRCPSALMVGYEIPGAFAQQVVVRANDALRLPPSVGTRTGALVEPLAIARRGIERSGFEPGDDVLVLGGGPIGLATLLWLQALGAGTVTVSDPQAARRSRAAELGAEVVDPSGDELAGRGPWQRVIECVGLPGLIRQACGAASVGGVAVVVGVCMGEDTFLPLDPLSKELDLRFSFFYRTSDFTETLAAMESGSLDPSVLVTDEIPLDRLPQRFEELKGPNDEAKVLVVP